MKASAGHAQRGAVTFENDATLQTRALTEVCQDSVKTKFEQLYVGTELDAANRAPNKLQEGGPCRCVL
jgi:hypothetical protein